MSRSLLSRLTSLFTLPRVLLVLFVLATMLVAYCVYLDRVVRSQFEDRRFSLPARVYARPLEVFPGKKLPLEQIQGELEALNYQRVNRVRSSAEFSIEGREVMVQTRSFEFWDGLQAGQRVRIRIANNQVADVIDDVSNQPLELFRLEPMSIGGIYAADNEDRQLVRYQQAPRHLIDALIAVEDQRFFFHHGVDIRSIGRAAYASLSGRGIQGGSTITQQLVKNFFLTPDRTLRRKFTEMIMALILEARYDKNDILETYINEVYFGQDGTRAIHGVGLASHFYFGRSLEQLEVHQSALLVAMLKGPAFYNPRRHPERALRRRDSVLTQTYEQGYIAQWEYEQATAQTLDVVSSDNVGLSAYPAFLDLVFRQLRRDYREADLRNEGLRVFTTLDPLVQRRAEEALTKQLGALEGRRNQPAEFLEGAVVISVPHTGEVAALVGGRNPRFEGFNRALDAKRPVGSLIKPAIYLTALEQPHRYSLASLIDDSELEWQDVSAPVWRPKNYDNEFHGEVPLWLAFANSYNVASARLGLELGIDKVNATVKRLGVEAELNPLASTFLGASELAPIDVAQMYQTIAAGGFRVPLQAIREVLTTDGEPLKRYGIEVRKVVDAESSALITKALQLAVSEGTGRSAAEYLPRSHNLAGKTGTSGGYRDSWFAGFSGDYNAVVWLGNDDNQNIGLTGASGALQVWARIMADIDAQPLELQLPQGVTNLASHRTLGATVSKRCAHSIILPFVTGAEPQVELSCDGQESRRQGVRERLRNLFR